ncbi:MAG: SGNH/GDSL hydrolase family protein [Verrucomicrobia bacterium]|nr:SGNH/GDSL hydrolase family protein [Verrucomicrobiota bacterium]
MTRLIFSLLFLAVTFTSKAEKPNVLLLGDSISIGYTPFVQKALADEAKVSRPMAQNGKGPENCQYAAYGLTRLDAWLGNTKWDVIHFNFGLHDIKYIGQPLPNAASVPQVGEALKKNPKAHLLSTVEDYAANLDKIVQRLQKTGATLIFCTTTPVPDGSRGRLPGDEVTFNKAALEVMKKHKVAINDLHAFASTNKVLATQNKANVHYSDPGSQLLAEQVVRAIKAALQ